MKFSASVVDDHIEIIYNIGGKGLLPKVSISGTNVQSAAVNLNQDSDPIKVKPS